MSGKTAWDNFTQSVWFSRLLMGFWMTIMWVMLWGELSVGNVFSGVLVSVGVLTVFSQLRQGDDKPVFRPLWVLALGLWFTKQVLISNLNVAREVLRPTRRSRIRNGIVACQLVTHSDRLATLIANGVSLTPGTLTIEAEGNPAALYVHDMTMSSPEKTRNAVAEMEHRVLKAFGTKEDLAASKAALGEHAEQIRDNQEATQ